MLLRSNWADLVFSLVPPPATSYAFLAKKWDSGIEILLGYFVAREIGVSYAISRRFLWWDMLCEWCAPQNHSAADCC